MKKKAFAAMAIATAFGIAGAACNVDANGPAQARGHLIKQAEYHLERARHFVTVLDMKEADRHMKQARRSMNESTRSLHEPGFQE